MNDSHARYIEIWNAIFYTLVNWSSERVLKWADEKYTQYLIDPNDMFYHESPLYWATDTLVSELITGKMNSRDRIDLSHSMLDAYWDLYHDMYTLPKDLIPFKIQVELIIKQYHEKINEH